jgi:hypothetical protein
MRIWLMSDRAFIVYSILVGFLIIPARLLPQTGVIRGIVVDEISKEPLPAATVVVLSTTMGASADLEGRFEIKNIPVGIFQIRISLVGYEPRILTDVVVSSARPAELDVKLSQVPIDIGAVEVTAKYFQKSPDVPVSIQRLSYEEIRRSPGGFEDVIRAVSVTPGVAQVEPGRNDLVVRGGAPSENLYVVENIEIPNINHFGTQGGTGGPLTYVNLDFVRETAFSTGGFGVKYGDRMSSVLNVDFRDGRSDRLGGKGTISATQFGLTLEGPVGASSSVILAARRSYLDFIFKANGFSFVPEYWDFFAKFSSKLSNSNTLSFFGIGAIDDVSFFNDDAEQRYENSRILGTAQRQYASGLSWQHVFRNGYGTLSLGRSFVRYNGVQRDSLLNPFFTNQSNEGETSLRGDLALKLGGDGSTELSVGTQVKRAKTETNLKLTEFVTPEGDTLSADVQDYVATGYKGVAYAQLSKHLPQGFTLTVGGRVDYYGFLDRKFFLAPRGSLSWEASPLTTLSASVGMYYQSPSYIWLAIEPRNSSLLAARVNQYVVGVEQMLRADLKLRIEGFYKRYSDYPASTLRPYLVLANTGGGYEGSMNDFGSFAPEQLTNAGKGRSYGVEFLAQKKLSEIPAYGLVSLTLSRTDFTALDGIERAGIYDQRVIFNTSGGYQFDDHWEASMRFRFGTGRPYTPYNPDGTRNVEDLNSERLPNWNSLDLRVDRRWNFDRWSLIVYLDIQNVYNNKFVGTPMWNARNQQVEYNESSVGILPTIGVSAEF